MRPVALWLSIGIAFAASNLPAGEIRAERVHFKAGTSGATLKGHLRGHDSVDYLLAVKAGQTLAVKLQRSNPQNYFNVLPPNSDGAAMFVGQDGSDYEGLLPADGDYRVRVYLMRPAARRNESSDYALTIGVTGKPLTPVPASIDAVIPGTHFHASTTISCAPLPNSNAQDCEAFVVRRSFDGTATVEVRSGTGFKRRILFIKGAPVASDSPEKVSGSRTDDLNMIRIGNDERYEIPDALLLGG